MPKYTRYGGQSVTAEEMKQIKAQPISAFLQFSEGSDGNCLMNYKFPENGKAVSKDGNEVHEFKIRENMNLLFQGIAKLYFDKNGNLKTDGIEKTVIGSMANPYGRPQPSEISEGLNIPAGKRADFEAFLAAMGNGLLYEVANGIYSANDSLQNYSNALKGYEKSENKDPEVGRYLEDSYLDYERQIEDLKHLAAMDPETETEVLGHMDCEVSSHVNARFAELINHDLKSPQLEQAVSTKIDMADMPVDPDSEKGKAFTQHFCFTAPIMLNGKEQLLSIEMTAPPDGKAVFRDENGKSATGIYDSPEQLEQYHKSKNTVEVRSRQAFDAVKQGQYQKSLLSAEDKAYVGTSEDMRKQANKSQYERRMSDLSSALVPSRDYETLAAALKSSTVYSKWRGSSENFDKMKTSFEALGQESDPDKKAELLEQLKKDAKTYLDSKDPMGDKGKEAKLSNYAKSRIQFARDVYQLASAGINQKTIADKPWLENAPAATNEDALSSENPAIAELMEMEKAARESLKDQSYLNHSIAPEMANKVNISSIVLSGIIREEMTNPTAPHPVSDLLNKKGTFNLVSAFANSKIISGAAKDMDGHFAIDGFLRNHRDRELVSQIRQEAAQAKQTQHNPSRQKSVPEAQQKGPSKV